MSIGVEARRYSTGQRALLLVTRALTATLFTAFVGAVENGFYERFFAPELYAVGKPFARGAFMFLVSFPYIIVGLILLGFPIAYVLVRLRAENALAYALAGAGAGILWGKLAIGVLTTTYGIVTSAFYGCLCALFWWWLRPRV